MPTEVTPVLLTVQVPDAVIVQVPATEMPAPAAIVALVADCSDAEASGFVLAGADYCNDPGRVEDLAAVLTASMPRAANSSVMAPIT